MPVDSLHPDYTAYLSKWQRMRHVIDGEDAVKAAGVEYLPKLEADNQGDYDAYKMRAQFFNATGRTRFAFLGMIFRVPPKVTAPSSLDKFIADAGLDGQPFDSYCESIAEEILSPGRAGTLVDWSDNESRPFVAQYAPECVINWGERRVGDKMVLDFVVLREQAESKVADDAPAKSAPASGKNAPDKFSPDLVQQIRVLNLVENNGALQYTVDLFQLKADRRGKKEWVKVETVTPVRRKQALTFIPFVFHNPSGKGSRCERPPLEDLAITNLSHYRTSADLEHGRHYTALPTPWITGVSATGKLRIGASTAWEIESAEAKVGMLEFSGAGLASLKDALEQKEHQMAILGAKMLEVQKKAAETAEVQRLKHGGEGAGLINIVNAMSDSMAEVVKIAAWWSSPADKKMEEVAKDVSVELNTDFTIAILQPAEITALVAAYQANTLTRESLLYNFERGGLLSPQRSAEEEAELLDTQVVPDAPGDEPPKPGE